MAKPTMSNVQSSLNNGQFGQKINYVTPKDVSQFRENLKKYYFCSGNELYVNCGNESYHLPISEIESFDDIYKLTYSGFYGDSSSPMITPKIEFEVLDWSDFIYTDEFRVNGDDFFEYSNNVKIWDNNQKFLSECKLPKWYTLDNKILRGFYSLTLGEFSGYVRLNNSKINTYEK